MDRDVLAELVQKLFFLNPNPDSATSQILNGRWVLLYTASGSDSYPFKGIEETMTGGGRGGGVSLLATPAAVTASGSDSHPFKGIEEMTGGGRGGGVSLLATPAAVTASPSDTSAAIHLEDDICNTLSSTAALEVENTKIIMSKPGEVIQGSNQRGEHVVVLGDHDAEPHVNNSTSSGSQHLLVMISKLMSGVKKWSLMKSLSS
ncbi:hypothetical protein CEUSTIGMA_g11350.t1 [Chlamydomonas eustigma]|uniref:Plastid lipid-associated protein/fibrillin conserved domain-containing protein n=1 Tax=Chlamydomonas eustigma TaxID=1157962 RepID=A0A250XLL4_9CHLO|nr:hypothetical protein CEUSTIGMA_g11350.t1 [Chlamydomonas eustigma]|eukprot:GAX83926.1 hypothetical protein CEUSTIGMA_g11350.t1 [Chlamydomonas eustigma]